MANQNIITTWAKASQAQLTYYSPVAVVPPYISIPLGTTYCFLSKPQPWDDENNPPAPQSNISYVKQAQKNMFVAKLATVNDLSLVIQRIDWSANTTYDFYQDTVNMLEVDANGYLVRNFYVKNKYDQVFKCLWNNNSQPSTVEPYFEPGTYNTNNIFQSYVDGYKWKYIYTIDTGFKIKFMDKTWIPIPVGANTPSPLITTAGAGSLDVINVTNPGSGYDPANTPINIVITGDGFGATAIANTSGNTINDIIVTNPGTNYTFANVTITSAVGSGATAIAPTSPVGGHGFDPISELGCTRVMITTEFKGSESDVIPTDITYHQVGIVINPSSQSTQAYASAVGINSTIPANNTIYKTSTDLTLAPGFGTYVNDEYVWQGPDQDINNATFIGTVLSFNTSTNVLRLINITGTPTNNYPVRNVEGTNRTLLSYSTPDFSTLSGYVSYLENRSGVTRSSDGVEQIRIVLGY